MIKENAAARIKELRRVLKLYQEDLEATREEECKLLDKLEDAQNFAEDLIYHMYDIEGEIQTLLKGDKK